MKYPTHRLRGAKCTMHCPFKPFAMPKEVGGDAIDPFVLKHRQHRSPATLLGLEQVYVLLPQEAQRASVRNAIQITLTAAARGAQAVAVRPEWLENSAWPYRRLWRVLTADLSRWIGRAAFMCKCARALVWSDWAFANARRWH